MPSTTDFPAGHDPLAALLFEESPAASFIIDANHRIIRWNAACARLTGRPAALMIGTSGEWTGPGRRGLRPTLADLIVDGSVATRGPVLFGERLQASAGDAEAWELEDFYPHLGVTGRWLASTARPLRDADGRLLGAMEVICDVTGRRLAQDALAEKEAFLAQIVEGSSVATIVIDSQHRITHWNHACEVLTGITASEVVGTRDGWKGFYPVERPIMADLILDGAQAGALDRLYLGRYRPSPVVADGVEAEDYFPQMGVNGRWLSFSSAPLRDARGHIVGAIEILQDISERRWAEDALRESEERYRLLSITDSLTGLYNSRHLHEVLQAEIERSNRYGRALSLLAMDADNFKAVNDTFGHHVGDQVLHSLADIITDSLRRTDSGFRYGGEEFLVVLPETGEHAAAALAERIRLRFAELAIPVDGGQAVRCTVSIGVATLIPGESKASFIRRADQATYVAKRQGKNLVVLAEGQDGRVSP